MLNQYIVSDTKFTLAANSKKEKLKLNHVNNTNEIQVLFCLVYASLRPVF